MQVNKLKKERIYSQNTPYWLKTLTFYVTRNILIYYILYQRTSFSKSQYLSPSQFWIASFSTSKSINSLNFYSFVDIFLFIFQTLFFLFFHSKILLHPINVLMIFCFLFSSILSVYNLFFSVNSLLFLFNLKFHNTYNFMCFSKNNNIFTHPTPSLSLFSQKESRRIQNQFQFGRSTKNSRNQYWPSRNEKMKDKNIKNQNSKECRQQLQILSTDPLKRFKKQRGDNKYSCITLEYYGECEEKYRNKSQQKSKKKKHKSTSREKIMENQRSKFEQPRNEYNEQVNEIKKNKVEYGIKQYLNMASKMNKRHAKQLSRLNDFSRQKAKKMFSRQKEEKLKLKQQIINWVKTVC